MTSSRKWMKILAVITAALFSITLVISLFAFNLERQLFNPNVYKQALAEQDVCGRMPLVLARQTITSAKSQTETNIMGLLFGNMDSTQLQKFFDLILPCQVVEKSIYGIIDQVFSYLNEETSQQGFSLIPIKQQLEINSTQGLEEIMSALPPCSAKQLIEIGANALLGGDVDVTHFLCNPPEMLQNVIASPIKLILDSAIQEIPNTIPLSSGLQRILDTLRTIRLIMSWSLLLPLIFLGMTIALIVRSWRDLLLWLGIPLLVSGVITLIVSLVAAPSVFALLSYIVFPNLPVTIVPEAVQLISDVFSTVSQGLTQPIQIQSAVISAIGVAMVLGEKLSRPKV